MDKYNEYSSKFHEKFMSLKIPTVEKCCCILDLRTAGIVLGGLTLIANLGLICYGEHVIWSGEYILLNLFTLFSQLKHFFCSYFPDLYWMLAVWNSEGKRSLSISSQVLNWQTNWLS